MGNPIQKCRQSSIVFKKPGTSSKNLKTFDELQLLYISIFFAETSQMLTTYQYLQKGVQDFFYFA